MIHIDFDFYINVRNILLIILIFFMAINIYYFILSFRDDADNIACTRKKIVAIIVFCAIGILLTLIVK